MFRLIAACALLLFLRPGPAQAVERIYYIAADEVVWDYAPSAPINPITAEPFSDLEKIFVNASDTHIGRAYIKAVYRAYTDAHFTTLKPRPPEESHLGILGPVIRAEVGDRITVVFRNNTRMPLGIHPHGVRYDKASEGAHYAVTPAAGSEAAAGGTVLDSGAHVPPGREYIYHWDVPEESGPSPTDPDSVVWLYHPHDHEGIDIYTGLIGTIVITRKGRARPDGTPKDADRELFVLFMIFDENLSPLLPANIKRFAAAPAAVKPDAEDFKESNRKHALNGLIYGNLNGLTMRRGERVRWYLLALGNESDVHTAHWHGNTGLYRGARTDSVGLLPAMTAVVDMRPYNPGTWMFHCHVTDHIAGGMVTRYTVSE